MKAALPCRTAIAHQKAPRKQPCCTSEDHTLVSKYEEPSRDRYHSKYISTSEDHTLVSKFGEPNRAGHHSKHHPRRIQRQLMLGMPEVRPAEMEEWGSVHGGARTGFCARRRLSNRPVNLWGDRGGAVCLTFHG